MQVETEYRIVSRVARLDGDQSDQGRGARTRGEVTVDLKILIDVNFRIISSILRYNPTSSWVVFIIHFISNHDIRPLGAMFRRRKREKSLKKQVKSSFSDGFLKQRVQVLFRKYLCFYIRPQIQLIQVNCGKYLYQ